MEIELKNVGKKFNSKIIVNQVNLLLREGDVFCLFGENGSGKSTIINLIGHLHKPDEGSISISNRGNMLNSLNFKKQLGFQSQYENLIDEFNANDFLEFIGKIYSVDKVLLNKRKTYLLNYFFEKDENISKNISAFSTGMKKKLQLCSALIHNPKVVLLDEPFSGLDPITCKKLCELIKKYSDNKKLIFVCSHNTQNVKKIATKIGFITGKSIVLDKDADFGKMSKIWGY
jgi:ABC-type multidrug transport system ATPase subunit